jgi:ATP-binding cassette subfamily D (ALD) long-chain fatty acid import protein
MAASSSGRSRHAQLLPGNPAVYSGAAALLALLVVLRRRVTDTQGSKTSGKGSKRSKSVSHTPLTTPQVEAAQRELYRVLPDGSRELLVPTGNSGRIAKVIIRPVKESTYAQHRKDFISDTNDALSISRQNKEAVGASSSSASAISRTIQSPAIASAAGQSANQVAKKVAVNKEFLRQLRAILKIIFPR